MKITCQGIASDTYDHQKYLQWNGERFRKWAAKIGDSCTIVTAFFLESGRAEQQGYKSCMALLKLADRYSAERIEYACGKVLSYTQKPSLKSIQTVLQSGRDNEQTEKDSPDTDKYAIVRGADYYRKGRGTTDGNREIKPCIPKSQEPC